MIREAHTIEVRVTEHPIEQGANVSDHAQARPRVVTVSVVVSETPIQQPRLRALTLGGPSLEGAQNRVLEFFEFIRSIAEAGEFIDVTTPKFGTISRCVIVRAPLEVSNVNEGRWTIEFRQLRLAERQTVQIPPLAPAPPAQDGAPDEQDVGTQPTENPESAEEAEDASILYGIGETLGFL
jgi:hypothetical protein